MKIILLISSMIFFSGCVHPLEDKFNSNKLISSKGEEIYINSVNWGMTDDWQLSIITKDETKLKDRADSLGAIEGLNPFIYHFKNDTLTLFFGNPINYKVKEKFKSITIVYEFVEDDDEYLDLLKKTDKEEDYFAVPSIKDKYKK